MGVRTWMLALTAGLSSRQIPPPGFRIVETHHDDLLPRTPKRLQPEMKAGSPHLDTFPCLIGHCRMVREFHIRSPGAVQPLLNRSCGRQVICWRKVRNPAAIRTTTLEKQRGGVVALHDARPTRPKRPGLPL